MELAKIMDNKKAQSTHFYKTWQQLVAMPTPEPFDWLVEKASRDWLSTDHVNFETNITQQRFLSQ